MASEEYKMFSEHEIEEFREAFNLFDEDHSGSISANELGLIMNSLGHYPSEEDINDMINEVDDDNNGELEFNEFVRIMAKITKQLQYECQISSSSSSCYSSEEELREAFQIIDTKLTGKITRKNLEETINKYGLKLGKSEIEELVTGVDKNEDGLVDFEDFCGTMEESVYINSEGKCGETPDFGRQNIQFSTPPPVGYNSKKSRMARWFSAFCERFVMMYSILYCMLA